MHPWPQTPIALPLCARRACRFTFDHELAPQKGKIFCRERFDSVLCRLASGWQLDDIEMVGTNPIPGLTRPIQLGDTLTSLIPKHPVWPSDHFGLLATFVHA